MMIEHITWVMEIEETMVMLSQEVKLILRVRPLENMLIIVQSNILRITVFQIWGKWYNCLLLWSCLGLGTLHFCKGRNDFCRLKEWALLRVFYNSSLIAFPFDYISVLGAIINSNLSFYLSIPFTF